MLKDYPDVLTVKQLAQVLHICETSAYRMIKNREIGYRKVGRKILIPKICLFDYLRSARYTISEL